MLRDFSIYIEELNLPKLKTIVLTDYEPRAFISAETDTWDFSFVVVNELCERFLGTVNIEGNVERLKDLVKSGCPIIIDLTKTSKHTGLSDDHYVLYRGKFIK